MSLIPLICPNCNGQIEEHKNERTFKCPFCRTKLLLKENNVYYVDQSVHHYHGTAPAPAAVPAKTKAKGRMALSLLLILAVFGYIAWTASQTGNTVSPGAAHSVRTEPKSEVLQSFLRDIFGKVQAAPTEEELASIRYLSVGKMDDQWHFTYSFDDPFSNEQAELVNYVIVDKLLNTQRIEQKDFEAFSGLTALDLTGEYEITQTGDVGFKHMKSMKSYSAAFNESFGRFAEFFEDKSNLLELTTQIRSNEEMALLLEFPNLRSLTITYVGDTVTDFHLLQQLPLRSFSISTVDDLKWLSSLHSLEALTITYSEATDFSSLYALSGLRELILEAMPNMKSIDFVKNMPNLNTLDMDRVNIVSLDPLQGKASLTKLRLASLSSLESVEEVNSLSSLSELSISGYYEAVPALTLPLVKHAEMPSAFVSNAEAPALQSLAIRLGSAGIHGTELAAKFPKLAQLYLVDSGSMYEVEALNQLPELRTINATDTSFYEDTRALFQLQNVTALSCAKCTFAMNGDEPFKNDVLEHLAISKSYYRVNNENVQNLDRVTPYLAGMTALRQFTLQDSTLQSLDFMADWGQAEVLHVENNAIANLDPLIPLPNLKKVYLAGNPVQNAAVLGDGVVVE